MPRGNKGEPAIQSFRNIVAFGRSQHSKWLSIVHQFRKNIYAYTEQRVSNGTFTPYFTLLGLLHTIKHDKNKLVLVAKPAESALLAPKNCNFELLTLHFKQLKTYLNSHGGIIEIDEKSYYSSNLNAVFQKPSSITKKRVNLKRLEYNGAEYIDKAGLEEIFKSHKFIDFEGVTGIYYRQSVDSKHALLCLNGETSAHSLMKAGCFYLPVWYLSEEKKVKEVHYTEVMLHFMSKKIRPNVLDGFEDCFPIYSTYAKYISSSGSSTISIDTDSVLSDFFNDNFVFEGRLFSQFLKDPIEIDSADTDMNNAVMEYFCNSDNRRINFQPYNRSQLEEHKQGHWDLIDTEVDNGIEISIATPIYARNPYLDVQKGSIIAIDFGTKSTVVVHLGRRGKPELLPVGGTFTSPKEKDYENPTMLHIRDFETFFRQYLAKAGRPETSWKDLTISHTALQELENAYDKNFFSFITVLKQWAATANEKIELIDDKGSEAKISSYLQLGDNNFDPIEVYAYYIGMAINNMVTRSIYTNYLLSFPVTYEKPIRDKLCKSFEKGLIKSLPNILANDENFLETIFQVRASTTEPAAYAVCALQSYGFDPQNENEVHYYGVFDFGGGTTDFDFGLWRGASDEQDEDDKSYVIEHFGAGGYRHLGGENLLEYLAYNVFSEASNPEKLRKKNIMFTFPRIDCDKFPGYQSLINENSPWANLNMQKMKETLRPVWEKHPGYQEKFQDDTCTVTLFDDNGEQVSGIILKANLELREKEIEGKVREGVSSFMTKMVEVMAERIPQPKKLIIFLAGNSCRAEIVRKIFDDECSKIEDSYRKRLSEEHEENTFEIFPPLGTKEADIIIDLLRNQAAIS